MVRSVALIIGVVLICGFIAHVVNPTDAVQNPHRAEYEYPREVSDTPLKSVAEPAIKITAPDLYLAYHSNEVAADERFKRHPLTVRGLVMEIRKDFTDEVIIELSVERYMGEHRFDDVHAYVGKQSLHAAALLSRGQIVTLNCIGGGMVMGDPILNGCAVVDEPATVRDEPEVQKDSAPVLIRSVEPEYSEDARDAKISGNVLVSATVTETGEPTNVHVVRGIGYGLDEKAVEAVSQYKFRPSIKNGRAVACTLNVGASFSIQ